MIGSRLVRRRLFFVPIRAVGDSPFTQGSRKAARTHSNE